jgi:Xaa-Pro aminopeptidase
VSAGFRGGFSAETFQARRDRVLTRLDGGAMVLPSAPLRYRSNDSEYRYRPDSELYYVSGFEEPECLVVLADHADTDRFVVFVQPRDPVAEQWAGSRMGVDAAREHLGADAAYPISELGERLPGILQGAQAVHYRLGKDSRSQALVQEALAWSRRRGARTGRGPRVVVDPGQILDDLRACKDPQELACMRRAADVTVEAFRTLAGALEPGVGEWELEAVLEGAFRARGAQGPAFASIVGSGQNGCVLHYVDNGDRVEGGDLVLVDAGAEVDYYAADITRTFPAGGAFADRQRRVYDIVASAHSAGVAACRAGASIWAPHEAAVAVLAKGLCALGLLEATPEEVVAEKLYRPFYPHQTSHWLGLDVHEPGDYAAGGEPRLLKPGMVLTVEPGLYFPPSLGEAAGDFEGIGIRIEDDVLVGDAGPERLTGALPVDVGDVQGMVGAGGTP